MPEDPDGSRTGTRSTHPLVGTFCGGPVALLDAGSRGPESESPSWPLRPAGTESLLMRPGACRWAQTTVAIRGLRRSSHCACGRPFRREYRAGAILNLLVSCSRRGVFVPLHSDECLWLCYLRRPGRFHYQAVVEIGRLMLLRPRTSVHRTLLARPPRWTRQSAGRSRLEAIRSQPRRERCDSPPAVRATPATSVARGTAWSYRAG